MQMSAAEPKLRVGLVDTEMVGLSVDKEFESVDSCKLALGSEASVLKI